MAPKVTLQTIADAIGVPRTTVSNYSVPTSSPTTCERGSSRPPPASGTAGRTPSAGRCAAAEPVPSASCSPNPSRGHSPTPTRVEFLAALAGMAESARQALLLVPCPPGEDQSEGVRNAVVDGFCVFTLPDEHPIVEEVLCRQLPTVFVDGPLIEGHSFVGIDDRAAMADLTRQMLGLGHRCLGVLAFRLRPDGWVGAPDEGRIASADFRVTGERLGGILDTTGRGRAPTRRRTGLRSGRNTRETARSAAMVMFARPDRPTAILCLSDQIAVGVLDAVDHQACRPRRCLRRRIRRHRRRPARRALDRPAARRPQRPRGRRTAPRRRPRANRKARPRADPPNDHRASPNLTPAQPPVTWQTCRQTTFANEVQAGGVIAPERSPPHRRDADKAQIEIQERRRMAHAPVVGQHGRVSLVHAAMPPASNERAKSTALCGASNRCRAADGAQDRQATCSEPNCRKVRRYRAPPAK